MLDFVVDEIASGLARLLFRLVPSIAVEVESLAYHVGANDTPDEPVVLTERSKRYCVELLLVNRRSAPVSVRSVVLWVNDRRQSKPEGDVTKIRLEARETSRQSIIFPISDADVADREGRFKLTVTPSVGRATTVTGRFPVQSD
jgi:hypothetical protein